MHLTTQRTMTVYDSEKVKMTINIGGEQLQLSVPFDAQNNVRDAENAASELFKSWRSRWPSRSDKEILAMVAYQFAFSFREIKDQLDQAAKDALDTDVLLDKALADLNIGSVRAPSAEATAGFFDD